MKNYIHARIGRQDREVLERLKKATGMSESDIVRKGLHLVAREVQQRSALDLAGASVGRFGRGPRDLSTNRDHLEGFGE